MVDYIRNAPHGVTSLELAEVFLKFKKPPNAMAHRAVSGVLGKDMRCILAPDGLWHSEKSCEAAARKPMGAIPWAAVYILSDPAKPGNHALHISIWDPFSAQACLLSEWLVNPSVLPHEERAALIGDGDGPFKGRDDTLSRAVEFLDGRTAIFLSSRQQLLLNRYCGAMGEFLIDDTVLLSRLLKICDVSVPKPLDLISCYTCLFNRDPILRSASAYGGAFSDCVRELILQLPQKGITSRDEMDLYEQKNAQATGWGEKKFSLDDILNLPQAPGVYGFKNRAHEYLYIGKAKNVRRRLMGYYHDTDESPEKLNKLRKDAYELSVYRCGSELESLLLENRLIKKHTPCFNTNIDINERKGPYAAIHDCIILLSHADREKGMSFWFRSGQKIKLMPFYSDFRDCTDMVKLLDEFFLSERLPAAFTDFAELEIAFRWIKRHNDGLCMIPVYRMASAEEIFDSLKCRWSDFRNKNGI